MTMTWTQDRDDTLSYRKPARAKVAPLIGLFQGARKDPLNFFLNAAQTDDVVEFPNVVGRFFMINNPSLADQILRARHRDFPKGDYYQRVRPIFGDGLFELEGEQWRHKRQTMQPAFHKKGMETMVDTILEEVETLLESWDPLARRDETIDILPPLMHMTFQIITRAMCGAVPTGYDGDRITDSLTTILKSGERLLWAAFPFIHHLPSPRNCQLKRALKTFELFIIDLVRQRREVSGDEVVLLDMLFSSRDPRTGQAPSARELHDDLMTMLIAGHETTALAIAWACYLLSKNPHVHEKLVAENLSVLGGRRPALEDLGKLEYHRQVVQETLRLYPPFWTLSRQARHDVVLDGYHLPARSTVMVAPYILHRNPRYWSNPEGFRPERFEDPDLSKGRNPAYFPFGAGPRVCIGKNLALMEAQLYLAMLVRRFDMELQPGHRVEAQPMISLRPRCGIRMRLKPARR